MDQPQPPPSSTELRPLRILTGATLGAIAAAGFLVLLNVIVSQLPALASGYTQSAPYRWLLFIPSLVIGAWLGPRGHSSS